MVGTRDPGYEMRAENLASRNANRISCIANPASRIVYHRQGGKWARREQPWQIGNLI
jgi:hypothetical protein